MPDPETLTDSGMSPEVEEVLGGQADPSTLQSPESQSQEPSLPPEGQSDTGTPSGGQDGEPPAPGTENQDPNPPDEAGKELEEALKGSLKVTETPEQMFARKDREHKAASKEARRRATNEKKFEEMLGSQGLKVIRNEAGEPVDLLRDSKSDGPKFSMDFDSLSSEEQELFDVDPQKAINLVVSKALSSAATLAPTTEKVEKPLSDERKESALEFLKGKHAVDGSVPDLDKNLPHVELLMNDPVMPKGLKSLINENPEFGFQLLNSHVELTKRLLQDKAQAAKKKTELKRKAAEDAPPWGPDGGGTPAMSAAEQEASDVIGKQIAEAQPV